MSPAEGIYAIVAASNPALVGDTTDWHARIGGLSALPNCVAFLDTGGSPGEARIQIEYPSVQVLIRGAKHANGYSEAYALAEKIHALLHGIPQNPSAMPRLVSCLSTGFINWLGRDDSERPQFSLNFRLITEPVTAGNRPL